MNESLAYYLIQPCKNRDVQYGGYHEDYVILDNNRFYTSQDAENYLESKQRIDFPNL